MKKTGQVKISVVNEAQVATAPGQGVAYVIGRTPMGPVEDPKNLITTWAQYRRIFGEGVVGSDISPYLFRRMLEQGVSLRVARLVPEDALTAETDPFVQNGLEKFKIKAKYPGSGYNSIVAAVEPSLDPDEAEAGYFNLTITSSSTRELFENLRYDADSDYLASLQDSNLITYELIEDSGSGSVEGILEWDSISEQLSGGTDGGDVVEADYTGALASFDEYYDGVVMCTPYLPPDFSEDNLEAYYAALSAKTAIRKDVIGLFHIPNENSERGELTEFVTDNLTLNKYMVVTAGGLKISEGYTRSVSETFAYAIILVHNFNNQPWKSPAGYERGNVLGTLGVVNNFGSPAKHVDLELITNSGINMVINRDNQIMFWNAYTMAAANSPEKFIAVVMLQLYMVRVLKPTLERFINEPNDFDTWSKIYYTVQPILDNLVSERALFEYKWQGDQFATSLSDLQINTPEGVQEGIYKIELQIKTISPIVVIEMDIILTNAGVEFK
jgi:hypothetical protein